MPGERAGVGAKCQGNAGEFWGNVRACEQCASSMQGNVGNTRGMYRSGCKVPGEFRVMPGGFKEVGEMCQENTGGARGTYGCGCKVPGKCSGIPGD